MIGDGAITLRHEKRRNLLGALARQRVDNPAFPIMILQKIRQLLLSVFLDLYIQCNIGPVKAGDIDLRLPAKQFRDNVAPRRLIRRRGERANGHFRKRLTQAMQRLVFRSERGTPLRNTMRLIDRNQIHIKPLQSRDHTLCHQAFGSKIEKPHLAVCNALPNPDIDLARRRRIDRLRRHTRELERRNLILH